MKSCLNKCQPGDVIYWIGTDKYRVTHSMNSCGSVYAIRLSTGAAAMFSDGHAHLITKIVKYRPNEILPRKL